MSSKLKPRMKKALERLQYECDYEDHRVEGEEVYIVPAKLAPGVGEKTLIDLENMGLISVGVNRWFDEKGYRITPKGKKALG